jgi:hypothetical protein
VAGNSGVDVFEEDAFDDDVFDGNTFEVGAGRREV